jgi:hypothetical protein
MEGKEDEGRPDGPIVQSRACEACGEVRPLTPKNWPRVVGTQHTFQVICKACHKAQKGKRKLERMEGRSVQAFVKQAKTGGSNIPHTSEMLESIMSLFGGSQGLASTMAQQYWAAPPGGRIRTSILELIMRLVVKTAESGATAKPVSLMSDEEIEAALSKRLETVASAHKNLSYLQEQDAVSIPGLNLMAFGNSIPEHELVHALRSETGHPSDSSPTIQGE